MCTEMKHRDANGRVGRLRYLVHTYTSYVTRRAYYWRTSVPCPYMPCGGQWSKAEELSRYRSMIYELVYGESSEGVIVTKSIQSGVNAS